MEPLTIDGLINQSLYLKASINQEDLDRAKIHRQDGNDLVWFDRLGVGIYPVDLSSNPYDSAYFDKYTTYCTGGTNPINDARLHLTQKYASSDDTIIDVGIGCGTYVSSMKSIFPNTYGYDINPAGVRWLMDRDLFRDPYVEESSWLTFWDSLEHIPRPESILDSFDGAIKGTMISCPVYESFEDVLQSKHFRTDEHIWYWTKDGLEKWMHALGYRLVEYNQMESSLGRDAIGTFAFR